MSTDPSGLFQLGATEILIVVLLIVMGIVWRRVEKNSGDIHDRISGLRKEVVEKVDSVKKEISDHEIACSRRDGNVEARITSLEKQVDTYTDARFQSLERAVEKEPGG